MNATKFVTGLLVSIALTGCATQPPMQAIDVRAISAVQAEIKRQVGVYILASQTSPRPRVNVDYLAMSKARNEDSDLFWCGSGAIGFDIATVKAELTTTLDTTAGASLGIKTPVIGVNGAYKEETINAQTLDYVLWPLAASDQPAAFMGQQFDAADVDKAPIAKVLLSLRDALILSALKYEYPLDPQKRRKPQPCFLDYNPEKPGGDAGHSFKIALAFTKDPSGGISIALALPVSPTFSITGESKATTGNSITVTFIQEGIGALQAKKDAYDKACAEPVKNAKACTLARAEYEKAKGENRGLGQSITVQ